MKKPKGNGAREKLMDYFANHRAFAIDNGRLNKKPRNPTAEQTDHILAWLYNEGYVVTPVVARLPARRAKYTGPTIIGDSHARKLIG